VDAQYKYFYRKEGTSYWTRFCQWTTNSTATFVPPTEGKYDFQVVARALGRTGVDVRGYSSNTYEFDYNSMSEAQMIPEATNAKELPSDETLPMPSTSASPDVSPVPTPSVEFLDEETQAPAEPEITSLAWAESFALSATLEDEVTADMVMDVQDIEAMFGVTAIPVDFDTLAQAYLQGEMVVIQLTQDDYAVLTQVTLDENGNLQSLMVKEAENETLIGLPFGWMGAWYYTPTIEVPDQATPSPEPSSLPEPEPSASLEPNDSPEPTAAPTGEGTEPSVTLEPTAAPTEEAPEPSQTATEAPVAPEAEQPTEATPVPSNE